MVIKPRKTQPCTVPTEKHSLVFTNIILLFYASTFCKAYKDLKAGLEEGPVLGALAFAMKQLLIPGHLCECYQLSGLAQPDSRGDRSWRAWYRLQARAGTYSK